MKILRTASVALLVFLVFGQKSNAQNTCTAECVMPDLYKTEIVTYYIYTGDSPDSVFTENQRVILKPTRTTWVKAPDPNCPSGEAEDCYIWKEVEQAEEAIDITIVTNVAKEPNYIIQQFSKERLVKKGGYTEVKNVICPENITPALMRDLSMRLTDLGYYSDYIYSVFNSKIKAALETYQRHNGLPVGHLNYPTLEALDLRVTK